MQPLQQATQVGGREWRPILGKSLPFHWPRPEHAVRLNQEEIWNNPPPPTGTPTPLAFYIHIPFCTEKCSYCDFAIMPHQRENIREQYVQALVAEIQTYGDVVHRYGYEVASVYYGGGTPSVLNRPQLLGIDSALRTHLPVSPAVEYGFECNASDVNPELLDSLKSMGVNRLSIGVQCFDDALLRLMNRAHGAEQAVRAIELVRSNGFDNFNIDLIYGYPTETLECWEFTLKQTFKLAPPRISIGPLSPLPHTELFHRLRKDELQMPTVESDIEKFKTILRMAKAHGYELGSYLSLVKEPRYRWNQQERMLRGEDCAGVGISAFGRTQGYGFINTLQIGKYMETALAGRLSVSRGIRIWTELDMAIYMVHGFKLLEINRAEFRHRFGQDPVDIFPQVKELEDRGLLKVDGERISPTDLGLIEIDTIMSAFYLADEAFAEHQREGIAP